MSTARALLLASMAIAGCGDDTGVSPACPDGDSATCCGPLARDCLGGACVAGACQPLMLADGLEPTDLAVAGDTVYFTDPVAGTVERVATDGSGRAVIASDPDLPVAVAATTDTVAWTTRGAIPREGTVVRMPLDGTAAPLSSTELVPCDLALDDAGAAWADAGFGAPYVPGPLRRWSAATGAVSTLLPAPPRACAVAMTADVVAVAGAGTDLHAPDDSVIAVVPRGGGAPVTIATGRSNPGAVALDDTHVYWAEAGLPDESYQDGAIVRAPRAGGAVEPLATATRPAGLVVIDDDLYWIAGSAVEHLALADRRVTTLAEVPGRGLLGLVTDGTALYFMAGPSATTSTGLLFKLAR